MLLNWLMCAALGVVETGQLADIRSGTELKMRIVDRIVLVTNPDDKSLLCDVDVGVLHRIDINGRAIGMHRPVRTAGDGASIEGRAVVVRPASLPVCTELSFATKHCSPSTLS
jgi:hypothetical protein